MKTRLVATLVLLALAGGLGYWFFYRNRGLLGTQLGDLAAAAPADTQVFMAVDLRQRHRLSELVALAREGAAKYPALLAEPLQELEKSLPPGQKLEEMADWARPAACMSWFPRAGQTSLLSREQVDQPFEASLAVALAEPDKVRAQLAPWLEKQGARLLSPDRWELKRLQIVLYRDVLLVTTGQDATERTLAALQGKVSNLAGSDHYQAALARVEHHQGGMLYLAPAGMLVPLGEMFKGTRQIDEETIEAFQSMQYAIGTLTPQQDTVSLQAFLGLDPKSESDWTRALLTAPRSRAVLARYVPAEWGNYHAVNLPYAYQAAWQTLLVLPGTRIQVAPLPMAMRFTVGYTPDQVLEALSGEIGVATHFDTKEPARSAAVLLLGVKDRTRLEEILAKLAPHIGALVPMETVDGAQLLGWPRLPNLRVLYREDALLAVASPDRERLVKTLLAVAAGKQPSLAEQPLMRQALEAAGESWVAVNYISMAKIGPQFLEGMRAEMEPTLTPENKKLAEDLLAQAALEMPRLESSGVVLVDPQGLRLRTFGNGLFSQSFTGGMLAAILVPNFLRARIGGQLAACKSNLKNYATAMEMYSSDHSGAYPRELASLTPNYLKSLSRCPAGGTYALESTGRAFTLFCQGRSHAQASLPANHPAYSSQSGLIER